MSLTRTIINAVYVFSVTFIFYIVFFSGIPQTSDEDLFLSAAQNIVVADKLSAPAVYGSTRLQGDYHGVEPAHPVLASFWYRYIVTKLPTGRMQGLYLLPVLYTSFASSLLVILAVQLNYSARTSLAAGILFGLATIAFPYAKTFYRETLVSFLILVTLVTFEEVFRTGFFWVKTLLAGVNIFLLVLILLTKIVLIFFVLSFIITLIMRTNDTDKRNIRSIFAFVALILIIISFVITVLFKVPLDKEIFYRFTTAFVRDAAGTFRSINHAHFLEAIIASLISPWKGFFIYSPICLVPFLSLGKLRNKKQICFLIMALITLIGLSASQALVYDQEWWTITWSARHLLPCVPLSILASLPWVEEILKKSRSTRKMYLFILFALGICIQLGAVIFNPIEYNFLLFEKIQDVSTDLMWNFSRAPMWGQWVLFMNDTKPDMAFWRLFKNEHAASFALLVFALFLAGLLINFWLELYKEWESFHPYRLVLSLTLIMFAIMLFVGFYNKDSYYNLQLSQIKDTCSELQKRVTANDIVIIAPYRAKIWFYFMNSDCLKYEWYSLPDGIEIRNDPNARNLAVRLLKEKASSVEHIWLVNQVWSEPEELRSMIQNDGYSLTEGRHYPFDGTKIIFDLYIKNDQ